MEDNGFSNFKNVNSNSKNYGFGKLVIISLISGIVGGSLVIGTCLGVPKIRTQLFNNNVTTESQKSESNNVTQNLTAVSLQNYSDTAINVAEKVLPSIVGIEIEYGVNSYFGTSKATASGSGIIISEDGNILTNNHVVSSENTSSNNFYQVTEAKSIKVKLYNDDTLYDATIVGKDDVTDLAVIKIEKT